MTTLHDMTAVDLLAAKLYRNECGIPLTRQTVMVLGEWNEPGKLAGITRFCTTDAPPPTSASVAATVAHCASTSVSVSR